MTVEIDKQAEASLHPTGFGFDLSSLITSPRTSQVSTVNVVSRIPPFIFISENEGHSNNPIRSVALAQGLPPITVCRPSTYILPPIVELVGPALSPRYTQRIPPRSPIVLPDMCTLERELEL